MTHSPTHLLAYLLTPYSTTQISLYVDNAVQMVLLCLVMVLLIMLVAPMLVPFGVTSLLAYMLIGLMTDRSSREVTHTSLPWR